VPYIVHVHTYGGPPVQYDQVRRRAKLDRRYTPGVISQMGGPTEDGWCLTTVFQTLEMAEEYSQGQLASALEEAGVLKDHSELEVVPVWDIEEED
jgi:hypothetical protein